MQACFHAQIAEHAALYKLMGQYTQVFIAQIVQTTACTCCTGSSNAVPAGS
jgi:hypothetical protein